MLEINRIFGQLCRKIAIIMLASLVWLVSIPATSVQAAGYYSGDYSTKDSIEQKIGRDANVILGNGGNGYIDRGKQAAEAIPKDLGTESRQENPLEKLKRAGEELGNNPVQRAFGSKE